ncbi:hypothetical protein [Paractinoplanes globisporus]|uniref:Bacterial CdiA-CT RNAse A domain-containing protein n=1 Tax=Paractinoplanes globisporus TaxID=113565 RepID=A0ABW6WHR8_9ACTN|nr:hypothetical protein [Actinoplanes globisporus]
MALAEIMDRHAKLGDQPPAFNIADNDDTYQAHRAHTTNRHGPDIALPRDLSRKTIEGRIHGDAGWEKSASASHRWINYTTMNREVNRYVRENWPKIRDDLAIDGFHENLFDAGHRVGEGYYNKGMYGAGPREAVYSETSLVRIRIKIAPGTDPPEPFIVSAFPAALG